MTSLGVVHGRFQIFHNDHLKYVMAARVRCEHLVVGITNPDPSHTREESSDPIRSTPAANPMTYFERYTMVRDVLLAEGLEAPAFSIVPFPINLPELYRYYLPPDATYYLTIYDEWGNRKLERFRTLGLKTEVLWVRPLSQKGLRSTDIRRMAAFGKPWEHLVPAAAGAAMKRFGIPSRLARLYGTPQS
ncbi:MAG: nicotinate-nucleotide adenylyltransferase [Deltaproteobacteria bacterium]|jgi:nicotinamide-nucleotide adenylyltransferase|nr:nicotinate-nucleotide adenylyltransferase [Deltaproteobacteria bacterium]